MFATWEAAYCRGTPRRCSRRSRDRASFNTAGVSGTFTPGHVGRQQGPRACGRIDGRVAGAVTPLVTVKLPVGQTLASLMGQTFRQQVTCVQACDVTTEITIALKDARKLGYTKATAPGNRVMVASSLVQLKPPTPTEVRFVVSADGKKLLPKAKLGVLVSARVTALSKATPQ